MKRVGIVITLLVIVFLVGMGLAADVVPAEVQQPGTQPNEAGNLETADYCGNCHEGYDSAVEPVFNWRGSMMANAARDPLFWATMAIAEQDFDGSGDLCIRCHSTSGWYSGRSTPTDGSGLAAADANGVDCDTCHKMTNPNNTELIGVMNDPFIANNGAGIGYYGSGMLSLSDGKEKLGPYDNATPPHQFAQSAFHRDSSLCGSCHDVSNPVVGDLAHNNGSQSTADAVTASGILGSALETKAAFNNFPYQYGIVERTFSEHYAGAFSKTLVTDYASLPEDLKAGAVKAAFERSGGDYEDGTERYFSCQTCHVRPTTGVGCNKSSAPTRTDLPLHDMTGGNYWVPDAIIYQNTQGTLRLGSGLTSTQIDAINAGKSRATQQLQLAASLYVSGDTLKITNLTGHKLISGYPEGRRMWLNIKWYDANNNLVREDGTYGNLIVDIDGTPTTVKTILDLDGTNSKIYEAHYGMTQEWADQLLALGYSESLPLSYDRETGDIAYTLGELALQDPGTSYKTFHFVLNNIVIDDNRIPPYGMSHEDARQRNILPVPATQYGAPTGTDVFDYWDNIALNPPTEARNAEIRLMYQPTSWEYIQFLYLANDKTNTFLAAEGDNLLDSWLNTGMAEPFMMASASWTASPTNEPIAFSKTNPPNGTTDQPTNPTIIWGTSTGAESYEYCYDTTNDNACANWQDNGLATSKTLSGLNPNTSYYWQVRAVNTSGTTYADGTSTAYWTFRTAIVSPGPFNKSAPNNGATNQPTSLSLSWTESSQAAAYEYCLDTTINGTCNSSWVNNGTSTSKALSGLIPGTPYEWHVRAINSGVTTYSDASTTAFWTFTTAIDSPSTALDPTRVSFQQVVGGLSNPIFITNARDGSNRLFVLERSGKIRIIKNGTLLATPFLDIQANVKSTYGEQGLLGLAFHPSYASNGKFYVTYTAPRSGDTSGSILTLKEFSVSANPDLANAASGTTLLTIEHPTYSNHNGGTLTFGGDGYLYWSTGDGGGGGDPFNNAQNLTRLLGKIIRIDVDSAFPYAIPTSNPFYASTNASTKLIWAYGLRNPWRMSFDRATHDLYIGDVGQNILEEIDFQLAASTGGENYGWDVMEASQCYDPPSGCVQSGKVLPVAEYNHTFGCSVTGGYVYRGRYPSVNGHYFYGDYCSGRIFSIYKNASSVWSSPLQVADTAYNITTFGEDEYGELYLADYATGKIYIIKYDEWLPYVVNIVKAGTSPTSAASVDFTVTFSETVTGVDKTDFSLTTTGISGALVTNVSSSGNIYIVTVDTGSGEGTIRLDLIDNDSIIDSNTNLLGGTGLGNGNFNNGETYTILPPPPSNDDFDNAIVLTVPDLETIDTRGATKDPDDPAIPACNINDGGKVTVWYKYSPSADSAIALDTKAADYDTFIAVWTFTNADLTLVACNDDTDGNKQSAVAFRVYKDVTYYIEIGQP